MTAVTRRLTKSAFALLAGRIAQMGLSFLFVIVLARQGVSDFGEYFLAFYFFELFSGLIATSLGILITREVARDPGLSRRYLLTAAPLVIVLSIISIFLLAGLAQLLGYSADSQLSIRVASVALAPAALSILLEAVFVAFDKTTLVTWGMLLESSVRIGLGMALVAADFAVATILWSLVAARAIQLLFYLTRLRLPAAGTPTSDFVTFFRKLIRDWSHFAVENWISCLYNSLGVLLLSQLHGEVAVGLFAAAARVTRLGRVMASTFTTAIFPIISQLHDDSVESFRRVRDKALRYILAVVFPMSAILSMFAAEIIALIYTAEYASAVSILQVSSWGLLLHFVNLFLSHALFAQGDQRRSAHVAFAKTAVFVVVAWWCVPQYGGVGVAVSYVVASLTAVVFYAWFALSPKDLRELTLVGGRLVPAVVGLMLLLMLLKSAPAVVAIGVGILVYVCILFLSGVVSTRDVAFVNRWFASNSG